MAQLGEWKTEQQPEANHRKQPELAFPGIARVSQSEWEAVCRLMEEHFRAGRYEAGAIAGVDAVGTLLARHYPPGTKPAAPSHNQLPDRPALL